MKISAMALVVITTILLLIVVLMAALNFSFSWVFYLTCVGQILVVYMVYKVLTDTYKTDKTFDDFYEDQPIPKDEQ